MNKKGRNANIDFNDPLNWPYLILYISVSLFVLFLVIGFVSQLSFDTQCSGVVNEKNVCCSDRDQWKNYALSLNSTINNCTNLIQEQINICDDKVNESVQECEGKIDIYADFVIVNRQLFVIYNLMILLWIPFTLNLFKIVFKVGLGDEWEKRIGWLRKSLLIIKIIFWSILTLGIVLFFINMLILNPLNS
tara:strand:+ start:2973 stop:3545 length:573 start_codon:yes stop_codon:yes gene_type:complete